MDRITRPLGEEDHHPGFRSGGGHGTTWIFVLKDLHSSPLGPNMERTGGVEPGRR
jgi:hypothetical protein